MITTGAIPQNNTHFSKSELRLLTLESVHFRKYNEVQVLL